MHGMQGIPMHPHLDEFLNSGTHLWYGLHLGKEDLKANALYLLILFAV
jgi:hypothetical protein